MATPEEREEKNRQLVAALREVFTPLTERLTPESEPATVYRLREVSPENEA